MKRRSKILNIMLRDLDNLRLAKLTTSNLVLGSNLSCFIKQKLAPFNNVLRRRDACIKSDLLLKIQWKEHHYLYEMDDILLRTFSHMIIMTRKMDPSAQRWAGILFEESSIKVIDAHRDARKA
jgi:hypothetical protein